MLPAPTYSFTIGSVHDDTPLDCRIYHPARWSFGESHIESPWQPRGAIITHPYTALGGSYDDGVVLSVVAEILKAGFVVGTFNFRGAGSSKGRSSWTGKPELLDYISFVGLFVYYLNGLRPPINSRGHNHMTSPTPHSLLSPSSCVAAPPPPPPPPLGITLILGGYSYGSLLTTYLPSASTLLDRFARASDETPEARIKSQALDLAARWNQSTISSSADGPRGRSVGIPDPGRMSMGFDACGSESRQRMSVESSGKRFDSVRQSLERSRRRFRSWKSGDELGVQTRPSTAREGESAASITDDDHHIILSLSQVCYLLISPLLPPVSLFATMFSRLNHHHDDDICSSRNAAAPLTPNASSSSSPYDSISPSNRNLVSHRTLAIYGTHDFLCSHRKLRTWAEKLAIQPDSLFRFREVDSAGHFWQEVGVDKALRRGIREWLYIIVTRRTSERLY